MVREDREKTALLVSYANQKGIQEEDINKIMISILSLKRIFNDICKNFDRKINLVTDMLSYTELFIPFVNVLLSIINNKLIDTTLISNKSFNDLKDSDIKYKMIINRILHKLLVVVNNVSKFQNVKNSNILRVNDEFKSPMFKTTKIQNNK